MEDFSIDIIKKEFGLRLRKLRKEKGFSQDQFAFETEINVSTISRIERGIHNPRLVTLYQLAEALNIEVKELFDFKNDG